MSEKSKEPKQADVIEDFPEEEVRKSKAEDKKSKSGGSGGIMAKANTVVNNPRKRGVDPILAISAVVFFVACIIVIGNTVYDKTLADHTEPQVEYGDNIEVDYIGCYNTFYDGNSPTNGAVIFDTSKNDLNENVPTSYEYNPSFSTLKFKAGTDTSLLMKFQEAVIGLRPGETTTVMIPADEAYGALAPNQKYQFEASYTIPKEYVYASAADFKTAFGVDAPASGVMWFDAYTDNVNAPADVTPYGFAAMVVTESNGTVSVTYSAEVGTNYVMSDYIHLKVTAVDEDGITFSYEIQKDKITADKVTLLKAFVDNQTVYVKVDAEGNVQYYKTTNEKTGEDLYFTITVLGYVSS